MKRLFTERHGAVKPRINEVLDEATTSGILQFIRARIEEHWFGKAFPYACEDGQANAGVDNRKLHAEMAAYQVVWPEDWLHTDKLPTDGQIFNLIEFSYEYIAHPEPIRWHDYHKHNHYRYDQDAGRNAFMEEINRIFERNGIAFELTLGEIIRLAPTGLQDVLSKSVFNSGDAILDDLLEDARRKFLDRDLKIRKESLEKLWDAWERLKTLGPGSGKAEQAQALLAKAANEPTFLRILTSEAKELTSIGNTFMIRHTEIGKIPIAASSTVDYLYHRMTAMISLLLATK